MSKRITTSDGFIKVTDEVGGIIVLVGVTTATYLCATRILADVFDRAFASVRSCQFGRRCTLCELVSDRQSLRRAAPNRL